MIYCLQEIHFSSNEKHRLKEIRCKMILQENGGQKKATLAILISGKTDFKTKKVTRNKDRSHIMSKRKIHQEDTTVINMYVFNGDTAKYIKQLLS